MLKARLETLGITVAYPLVGARLARARTLSAYERAIAYYQAIATHDFHVVFNEHRQLQGYIDEKLAQEMLFAMLQRRPIMLLHMPQFQTDVDTFAREIIERHLRQIIVGNLPELDIVDTTYLLRNVASQPIWYMLNNRDSRLIANRIRAYFRHFFEAGNAPGGQHGNR